MTAQSIKPPVETVKCHYCEQDRPKHQLATYPHGIFCSNNSLNPTEPPCWKAAAIHGTRTLREVNQQNRKSALLAALGAQQSKTVETTSTKTSVPTSTLPSDSNVQPNLDKKSAFLARLKR